MKHINQINKPIIGKKYLVPCILNSPYADWLPSQWTPILFAEESHEDHKLGVNQQHFHYDTRFIAGHKLIFKDGYCIAAAKVASVYPRKTFNDLINDGSITYRSRTCFRTEQILPFPIFQRLVTDKIKQDFIYTRMENMTCPHKGTCLKGHPIKDFHKKYKGITCPAHGLSWDIETGFLIE